MADVITQIEDAIMARVRALFAAPDGRSALRQVASLPSDWDVGALLRDTRALPGVFVAFGGGSLLYEAAGSLTLDASWAVFAVTRHASGEAARRRGDGQQIGAYEISAALASGLHQFEPLPDQAALRMSELANLYTGEYDAQGVAVYALTLRQELTLPLAAPGVAANLADWLLFDARIDTPPHSDAATHAAWLAEQATVQKPEARVIVNLPAADEAPQ